MWNEPVRCSGSALISSPPPSRALTAGDSRSGVSTAWPAMRPAAARMASISGSLTSEPRNEVIEDTSDFWLVEGWGMADAGHGHRREIRLGFDHARKPVLGQNVGDRAAHDEGRRIAQRAEDRPQVLDLPAAGPPRLEPRQVPIEMQPPVPALSLGG